jgi:hypothetical protein
VPRCAAAATAALAGESGRAAHCGIIAPLMTLTEILALALAVAAGWLVWDSLKAREAANAAMRDACRRGGFLFLDDTVALNALRPVRDGDGHMRLRRVFTFEYSDTGTDRRKGSLTMTGDAVSALDIGPPPPLEGELLH